MAEALAVVGGLAALLQIAGSSRKLSREFLNFIRTVRNTPREIEILQQQLSNFSESLTMFHHNSNEWLDSMLESPQKNRRKKHLAGLIKECKAVKDGAKELRERLFPPKPSKSRNELGILYRIRWYFQKASVAGLNLMLESAKTSIMLFITLQMCEGLRKRIDELEQELNKPPGEIKTLKHQLRHTRRQLRDQIEYVQRIHERLEQHTMNSLVSGSVIGTSAQTVVSEMHAMEQYFVNTLQAETMNSELEALQEEMVEQEATYYTTSTGGF